MLSCFLGCFTQIKLDGDDSFHQLQQQQSTTTSNEIIPTDSIILTPRAHSLEQLPNELLSLIFHHLPPPRQQNTLYICTRVSKPFYFIANPLLWQAPQIGNDIFKSRRFFTSLFDTSPHQLATLGKRIRALQLTTHHWTDHHLFRLMPHIASLQHLTIDDGTSITNKCFQHVPYSCLHLTSLELHSIGLTQAFFSAIGRYCRHLRSLSWYLTKTQSPEWLALLLDGCPLACLKLSHRFSSIKDGMAIIQRFDHLTTLDIYAKRFDSMDFLLDPSWPQLTHLTMDPCQSLEDPMLVGFIKSHPYLQQLHLTYAKRLTDASLDAMIIWLPHLKRLVVTENRYISSGALRRLVCGCVCLVHVVLKNCRQVATPHFTELFDASYKDDHHIELDQWRMETIRQKDLDGNNNH